MRASGSASRDEPGCHARRSACERMRVTHWTRAAIESMAMKSVSRSDCLRNLLFLSTILKSMANWVKELREMKRTSPDVIAPMAA